MGTGIQRTEIVNRNWTETHRMWMQMGYGSEEWRRGIEKDGSQNGVGMIDEEWALGTDRNEDGTGNGEVVMGTE